MTDEIIKKKRTRPDKSAEAVYSLEAGDNARFINNSLTIANLPPIDDKDPQQVKDRINEYFSICAAQDVRPSVVGLALAFDWNRQYLWRVANGADGTDKKYSPDIRNLIKKAYNLLNLQLEDMMLSGRVNPVTAIFLGKNHFAYSDKTELSVSANNSDQNYSGDDIAARYQITD